MDITQILITAGALLGIAVVAVLAIVPMLLEIPAPKTAAPNTATPKTAASLREPEPALESRPLVLRHP